MSAIRPVVRALTVVLLLLITFDFWFGAAFPHFPRLRYNFSSAYLTREVTSMQHHDVVTVFGDSVLWGFGVPESRAAITLIRAKRSAWHNLAFAGGSPANTLAVLQFLLSTKVRPSFIVFNVNQKIFNAEDSAYRRLHPSVEQLALARLPAGVRSAMQPTMDRTVEADLDRMLSRYWRFYGMRSDVRDVLFGDVDAAHMVAKVVHDLSGASRTLEASHHATADKFEGTYDLSTLTNGNVQYAALSDLAALIEREHLPTIAILTPTNHRLLHDYIDVAPYQKNLRLVRSVLRSHNVRVIDLDAAFPPEDFLDNDHLTIEGNRKLAAILDHAVGR